MKRRTFLHASSAVAAAGLAPAIWTRRARAADAFGSARHLLLLFAQGGVRSHAMFNAVGSAMHNPFGALPQSEVAPGTQWVPGALRHDASGKSGFADIDTTTGTLGEIIPGFHRIAADIAVLSCVDHTPGEQRFVAQHDDGVWAMSTGSTTRETGLLARVGRDHPMYRDGFSADAVPPVFIGPTDRPFFAAGFGDYAGARPLVLPSAGESFTGDVQVGKGWKLAARAAMGRRFVARRSAAYRERIETFVRNKAYVVAFADILQDARLNILGDPDATDGVSSVTNGHLVEALGSFELGGANPDDPDEPRGRSDTTSWGADVALALRMLSFGVPAAVVVRDLYDLHDDERDHFRPHCLDLARQLAALRFLLPRLEHPGGGTYWDHTVVAVVSDFGRNAYESNGFNSGFGSDHGGDGRNPGAGRNQALPLMGGPISALGLGGKRLGTTDGDINALEPDRVYSSQSLLSTFLHLAGMGHDAYGWDPPIADVVGA